MEFIGLLFAAITLFILAVLLGALFAFATFLFLRKHTAQRKRYVWQSALLPLICLIYIVVTTFIFTALPGYPDLLFGDIAEPLPNGYILTALGKMPDYGSIQSQSQSSPYPQLSGYVSSIEVDGPKIFGSYGRQFREPATTDGPGPSYFVFDTQNQQVVNFESKSQLDSYAGHSIALTDNQFYRSADDSHRALLKRVNLIRFWPPLIANLLYFLLLVRYKYRAHYLAVTN